MNLVIDPKSSQDAAVVILTVDQIELMIEAFRHITFTGEERIDAIRAIRKLNQAHIDLTGTKHGDVASLIDTMNGRS